MSIQLNTNRIDAAFKAVKKAKKQHKEAIRATFNEFVDEALKVPGVDSIQVDIQYQAGEGDFAEVRFFQNTGEFETDVTDDTEEIEAAGNLFNQEVAGWLTVNLMNKWFGGSVGDGVWMNGRFTYSKDGHTYLSGLEAKQAQDNDEY